MHMHMHVCTCVQGVVGSSAWGSPDGTRAPRARSSAEPCVHGPFTIHFEQTHRTVRIAPPALRPPILRVVVHKRRDAFA